MNARIAVCLAVLSAAASAGEPAVSTVPQNPAVSVDLGDLRVQAILRAAARAQSTATSTSQTEAAPARGPTLDLQLRPLVRTPPVRGWRPPGGDECVGGACVVYDDHGNRLFPYQRNLTGLIFTSDRQFDEWLACQQDDDLLSTFERYERCNKGPAEFRTVDRALVKLPRKER